MAWMEASVMSQRAGFVTAALSGEESMSASCARFGVSRKTGYKWLARYKAEGAAGLVDRSRAPLEHGRATGAEIAGAIVALRQARPSWGPRKLIARLAHLYPATRWPSHSTASAILKQAGAARARRVRRRVSSAGPLTIPARANHVWSADHKGWVRLGDRTRCEPLTVTCAYSRYVVALAATSGTGAAQARPVFARAFAEHGLPEIIRSDNGAPFAAPGAAGLTGLSAWWIKLGVRLERTAPGKPQQNGRHERFHRTLIEAMAPPEPNARAQQARFDLFRRDYNETRPHEALGQVPPARLWTPSPRAAPAKLPTPDYRAGLAVRRVRTRGEIKWRGNIVHVSGALIGEWVALEEEQDGHLVRFFNHRVGRIAKDSAKLSPIYPG